MCVEIESQNMEASMKEEGSLVIWNEVKSNWKSKLYIQVSTQKVRRGKSLVENGYFGNKECKGN
jgi:hypothetical protein